MTGIKVMVRASWCWQDVSGCPVAYSATSDNLRIPIHSFHFFFEYKSHTFMLSSSPLPVHLPNGASIERQQFENEAARKLVLLLANNRHFSQVAFVLVRRLNHSVARFSPEKSPSWCQMCKIQYLHWGNLRRTGISTWSCQGLTASSWKWPGYG